MRGYDIFNYTQQLYDLCSNNCATYSTKLYDHYNKSGKPFLAQWGNWQTEGWDPDYEGISQVSIPGLGTCYSPGEIYNVL
jgi:hypothetical protein